MHTALLIDKLNDAKKTLLDYIPERGLGIGDDVQRMVEENLMCSSWQEVVEKFAPCVYIYMNADQVQSHVAIAADMENTIRYSECQVISFHTQFDKMPGEGLCDMSDMVDQMLVPAYWDAFASDKWKLVQNIIAGNETEAKQIFYKMKNTYNNSLLLVYYYIQAYDDCVEYQDMNIYCVSPNKEHQMQMLETGWKPCDNIFRLSQGQQDIYCDFVERELMSEPAGNKVLWRHCLLLGCDKILPSQYAKSIYSKYLEFYLQIVDSYWKTSKPLLENLLGIRCYFEHCDSKRRRLLISNISAEDMFQEKQYRKLEIYLEYCNEKIDKSNQIEIAMLPSIERKPEPSLELQRERFPGKGEIRYRYSNSKEKAKRILDLLAIKRIPTMLSSRGESRIKKLYLEEEEIRLWYEDMNMVTSSENEMYAYPCFPNFVYISDAHAVYEMSGAKIPLSGICMEAAYVGLKAAWDDKTTSLPKLNFVDYSSAAAEYIERRGYGMVFAPSEQGIRVICKGVERE